LGGSLGTFIALSQMPHQSAKFFSNDRIVTKGQDASVTAFNDYISKFGKTYLTRDEYLARLDNFKTNMKYIEKHNAENNVDYKLEVNLFTDWSDAERDRLSLNYELLESHNGLNAPTEVKLSLPTAVDWR